MRIGILRGSAVLAWYLLIAGVAMLFLSRAFVAYAAIPPAVNFLHFPLIFGAFVLSRGKQRTSGQRAMERALAVSLTLAVASVVLSPTTPALQTALTWVVLVEPLLVVLTVWHLTSRGLIVRAPRLLALSVVLAQVPVALFQWVLFGSGDEVQGFMVNQGAGHHLLGVLGLTVAIVALNALLADNSTSRLAAVLLLVAGLALPVLADMRQGILVFIVVTIAMFGPAVVLGGKAGSSMVRRLAATGVLLGTLGIAAVAANQAVALARQEPWRGSAVIDSKIETASIIATAMRDQPLSPLVGLGGGATATRVAWLATPLGSSSFLAGLDLPASPIAGRLAELWVSNPQWVRSSASSPFSTWLGVFGDLGILGLAAYATSWLLVWRCTASTRGRLETRALMLFLVILGLIGNWLEEPQLVVVAALLVGAGSAPGQIVPTRIRSHAAPPHRIPATTARAGRLP